MAHWRFGRRSVFLHLTLLFGVNENNTGITIGAVVVPQGMAYALLAELPPQFGLYTSFMGVLIYWFFATSKDITIGVSSTLLQIRRGTNQYLACCRYVNDCGKYCQRSCQD